MWTLGATGSDPSADYPNSAAEALHHMIQQLP